MSFDYRAIIGKKNIINEIYTSDSKGNKILWIEADLRNCDIDPDDENVRWGGKTLKPEEQLKRIREESPKEYRSLKNSMETFPTSSEPVISYLNKGMKRPKKIHGHRRGAAASEMGIEFIRVLIAINIAPKKVKFLRDHPEANPSKVPHTNFARARVIYNELKEITDPKLRGEAIDEISRRTGVKKAQILTAERQSKFMDDTCARLDLNSEDRAHQFKTFSVCDQINESEFQELRHKGDFEKLEKLDGLMLQFISHQVTHDDIKTTVKYLSKAKSTDPLLKEVMEAKGAFGLEQLRRLEAQVRLELLRSEDSVIEITKAVEREWSKTLELQDKAVAQSVANLLKIQTAKFQSLADNLV